MSVSGISSTSFANYGAQSIQNRMQTARQEFQQLGQDLQSGNLTAAQSDFATLQQSGPQSGSSTQSSSPVATDLNQLATDLKAGNTTAAQQDYTKIQQDFQSQQGSQTQTHHHHHHHGGGGSGESNSIDQLLSQMGQALQSGNLSTAQQAYASLQQDFGANALPTGSGSSGVSVTA